MVELMELLYTLILDYPSLEYIFIFLGATLGGELALFVLGFLLAQDILSIFPVIILGFLGAFVPNLIWYFLGGTSLAERIISHRHSHATFLAIIEAVRRMSRGKHLTALIVIKFLVGTPVLLTLYINKTALSFKQFSYYQSITLFLSMLVIISTGYVSGRGFSYVTEISQNLYTAVGFILFIVFVIIVFQIWLEKKFTDTI